MTKSLQILLITFVSLCMMSGCSSKAQTSANKDFDFNGINSYSLFERDSDFTDWQHLSDFERNRIEIAIENTMDRHDFSYKSVDEADVVVSYFLVGRNIAELNQYNKKVKACLGCTKRELKLLNYNVRPSTLIIDILDGERLRSVYRSHVQLKLRVENDSETNREIISEGVDKLLADIGLPK